ncbi:hypothetical protein BC832DRAFT_559930 [Gaertneriomyces semiglobifer]|nr:hypothetical protein BC832DRAFT_559930 [Gaertneriomyces semiglobifer]
MLDDDYYAYWNGQDPPYDSDTPYDVHGDLSYRPFNRGNKLKPTLEQPAVLPTRPGCWGIHAIEEGLEYVQVNKRRAIVQKRIFLSGDADENENEDDEDDDEENPYAGINIENIWSLPTTASSSSTPNSLHHLTAPLRTPHLKALSNTCISLIESEQHFTGKLARFARILQSDDPLYQDWDNDQNGVDPDLLRSVREQVQELMGSGTEFVERLSGVRERLLYAHRKKKDLVKRIARGIDLPSPQILPPASPVPAKAAKGTKRARE